MPLRQSQASKGSEKRYTHFTICRSDVHALVNKASSSAVSLGRVYRGPLSRILDARKHRLFLNRALSDIVLVALPSSQMGWRIPFPALESRTAEELAMVTDPKSIRRYVANELRQRDHRRQRCIDRHHQHRPR